VGPLLDERGLARTRRQIEAALATGATVLTGGRARPDLGPLFHEPTVLTGTRPGMAVRDCETFGPVLCLQVVDDVEEALAELAGGRLNASVWTADLARGTALAHRIRAGSVNLNEGYAATYGSLAAPMGGFGVAGSGRRNGPEGLLRFTAPQAVATTRGVLLHSCSGCRRAGGWRRSPGISRCGRPSWRGSSGVDGRVVRTDRRACRGARSRRDSRDRL
jgi:succinate-semialdehyde dehydrogenase/glutarate-semialdehyde dehydrogenase